MLLLATALVAFAALSWGGVVVPAARDSVGAAAGEGAYGRSLRHDSVAPPSVERGLDEVVVTATGTAHRLKDVPVQTEVIGRRELEQMGGRSIEEILSTLTSSFAFSEDDMGSQMQMGGLGNAYILILIDGKRLHGDNGGENDLGLIDPARIERIEIVKGAASALYGSDAIAGVVNIITRKYDRDGLLLENTTRGGSYSDLRQHNAVGLAVGRFSSLTSFQLQHSDGWQNTASEDPRQTEFPIHDSRNMTVNRHTNWQVAERMTFAVTPGLELYAEGSIYWKRIYRPSGKYAAVDVKTYDLQYRNASASVGGRWVPTSRVAVTLDVDWNRHAYEYVFTDTTLVDGYDPWGRFTHYFPYFPGQTNLQSDQRRTMAHLKGVFELPARNRLSAGIEGRWDWLKAPMRVDGGGTVRDNTEALYVQDEWSPWRLLQLTGGLRLDRNAQFGLHLTPKLSAMVSPTEWLRLRASWSQGFKTPTPKEQHYRYVREMSGTYLYLGNASLRPQTSNYGSLSAEVGSGGLSVSVTGYVNKVDDMITLVTIPNYQAPAEYQAQYELHRTRQYQNLDDARTWGIDLGVRYVRGDWTVGGSYSWLETKAHRYDADHDRMQEVVIDGTAHHRANCFATWQHAFRAPYRLGIGIYGRASSERHYQLNGNGRAYHIWRLTTSHDIDSRALRVRGLALRVEAGVDNIFNYVDRTPHGLHLGTTTPGTTFYSTLTLRLRRGKTSFKTNPITNYSKQSTNNEED
ncbi:MAG: TonB-dependent receptor [Bacteroidaceae bacterium]|nr:TonB-dependent receptor [Bacteroidaceae bacterium]